MDAYSLYVALFRELRDDRMKEDLEETYHGEEKAKYLATNNVTHKLQVYTSQSSK